MKVKYNGVELLHATAEIRDIVEKQLRPEYIFQTLGERARGTQAWTYINNDLHQRGIKLDSVWWPMGALRWAVGYFLCTGEDLAEILKTAVVGGSPQKCQLLIGDGVNDDLSLYMTMLPPLPLFQYGEKAENLYLLTLVDERYYWWFADSVDFIVAEGCDKTWVELLDACLTALGTHERDTPDSAYLKPCHAMTCHFQFLPQWLETAAYQVGMRVHIDTDQTGKIYVKNADSALQVNDTLYDQDFIKVLGPKMFAASDKELAFAVPKKVTVGYPKQTIAGQWSCKYDKVTYDLASLSDSELIDRLISKGVVGFNQAKWFHDTAIWYTVGGDDNTTEINDLTKQIATDFYKYQLGRVNGVYAGIRQVPGHGLIDSIEWCDTGEEVLEDESREDPDQEGDLAAWSRSGIYTIVRRHLFNDLAHEMLHCSTWGCDPECEHWSRICTIIETPTTMPACTDGFPDHRWKHTCAIIECPTMMMVCVDDVSVNKKARLLQVEDAPFGATYSNITKIRVESITGLLTSNPSPGVVNIFGPGDIGAKISRLGNQTITSGSVDPITWTSADWESTYATPTSTGSYWTSGSQIAFTAAFSGVYQLNYAVRVHVDLSGVSSTTLDNVFGKIKKTGVEEPGFLSFAPLHRVFFQISPTPTYGSYTLDTYILHCAQTIRLAASDYVELFIDASASTEDVVADLAYLTVQKLNAAASDINLF